MAGERQSEGEGVGVRKELREKEGGTLLFTLTLSRSPPPITTAMQANELCTYAHDLLIFRSYTSLYIQADQNLPLYIIRRRLYPFLKDGWIFVARPNTSERVVVWASP